LLDVRHRVLTSSGRAALAIAFKALGLGPNDRVLVPAYHCPAVTGPVAWIGASVDLYRVTPDFEADLADLAKKVTRDTKALVLIHYFGLPRRTRQVREFCDAAGIALIEDCAHTLHGSSDAGRVGTVGDFAIASLTKFFTVFDGGLLASASRPLDAVHLVAPPLGYQLKAAYRAIDREGSQREGIMSPARFARAARSLFPPRLSIESPAAADGGSDFDAEWVLRAPAAFTGWTIQWTDLLTAGDARRIGFQRLAEALGANRKLTLPFRELPGDAWPYVLPVLVERGHEVAQQLRARGIPVFQWDRSPTGDCEVAARYAKSLLQVPCHQGLSHADFDAIVAGFAATT